MAIFNKFNNLTLTLQGRNQLQFDLLGDTVPALFCLSLKIIHL